MNGGVKAVCAGCFAMFPVFLVISIRYPSVIDKYIAPLFVKFGSTQKPERMAKEIQRKAFHINGLLLPLLYWLFVSNGMRKLTFLIILASLVILVTLVDGLRTHVPSLNKAVLIMTHVPALNKAVVKSFGALLRYSYTLIHE
ncbi:hypothetical protein KIPB_010951 [Kipferlia bialata]|uniref:Uncharacterized protein n=1 Tax=Kipferlia bialata TaxID=797122 RepID=A0A9K3D3U6_9EUKA|nr:hypothetical protein KIPB_010951 [Kipferlia bialata]|eukprot:g10951.t1